MNEILITNDAVVFGLLALCLGFIFYTSSLTTGFWSKFYNIVPAVLMCYLLIPIWQVSGAAIAVLASHFITNIAYIFFDKESRKELVSLF